ncbi:MAG: dTMP kinase [Bacteroidota bacterium]
MFITFEGLDYSGKSTQVQLLVDRLSRQQFNVLLLREPGGTEIGERIRTILLDKEAKAMTTIAELFLFSASRAQLVEEVIKPALDGGLVVVCDRFYDSTTAYQGSGRQIGMEIVQTINRAAVGGLTPALTLFIDIPVNEVEKRMRRGQGGKDRMESNGRDFYERVRSGYLDLAKKEKRFAVINGMQPIDVIEEEIWTHVGSHIGTKAES